MTKLTIHIGDPKTGTSSIQRALHQKLVTCAPLEILPWHKLNAVSVANGLRPQNDRLKREPFSNLKGWLDASNADIAVISSEFFAWVKPRVLQQALSEHLPVHAGSAEVIAYVRPHASRFLAAYVQRMKAGRYLGDFDTFLAETAKTDLFHYSARFGRWHKTFGSRFTLKPFIRSELRDNDIVADFFAEILRGAPYEIQGTVEENVAVTSRALAGLRLIHRNLRKTSEIERRTQHLLGETLANWFLPMGPVSGDKPRLDRRTAERLIEAHSEDARMLDTNFFERPLMQEALGRCTDNTSDEPLDLSAERYFRPDELRALVHLGAQAARRIADDRPLFGIYQSARNGNLTPSPQQSARISEQRAKLEDIDTQLTELAQILRG